MVVTQLVKSSFGQFILFLLVILFGFGFAIYYLLGRSPEKLAPLRDLPVANKFIDLVCFVTGRQAPSTTEGSALRLQLKSDFDLAKNDLKQLVYGHKQHIDQILGHIEENLALRDARQTHLRTPPLGIFIFIGPKGVGKQFLARGISNFLFEEPICLAVDMESFEDGQSAQRYLFGTGAEDGALIRAIRKNPYHTIILENVDLLPPVGVSQLKDALRSGTFSDIRGNHVRIDNCLFFLIIKDGGNISKLEKLGENSPQWLERAAEMISAKTELPLALLQRVQYVLSFSPLRPRDKACVILKTISRLCREHRAELDWVDPEILVEEVMEIKDTDGFSQIENRIEKILRPELLKAARSGQKRIRLLTPEPSGTTYD